MRHNFSKRPNCLFQKRAQKHRRHSPGEFCGSAHAYAVYAVLLLRSGGGGGSGSEDDSYAYKCWIPHGDRTAVRVTPHPAHTRPPHDTVSLTLSLFQRFGRHAPTRRPLRCWQRQYLRTYACVPSWLVGARGRGRRRRRRRRISRVRSFRLHEPNATFSTIGISDYTVAKRTRLLLHGGRGYGASEERRCPTSAVDAEDITTLHDTVTEIMFERLRNTGTTIPSHTRSSLKGQKLISRLSRLTDFDRSVDRLDCVHTPRIGFWP